MPNFLQAFQWVYSMDFAENIVYSGTFLLRPLNQGQFHYNKQPYSPKRSVTEMRSRDSRDSNVCTVGGDLSKFLAIPTHLCFLTLPNKLASKSEEKHYDCQVISEYYLAACEELQRLNKGSLHTNLLVNVQLLLQHWHKSTLAEILFWQ